MERRNLFHGPEMPTADQDPIWSRPRPGPHLHLGNGSCVTPTDGAASTAVSRPTDYPSSSYSSYMVTNSGPLHDPYMHASSSSRYPPDQVLCMPAPNFSQHGSTMVNPQSETGGTTFKRKNHVMPLPFSRGNTSGHHSAGSSSDLNVSTNNHSQPNFMTRPLYWSADPASTHSYRNDNFLTAAEEIQRNVRSRHNQNAFHTEISPGLAQSSTNVPHHFHGAGMSSVLGIEGQLSSVHMSTVVQGRNPFSGPSFNYEGNQSLAGTNAPYNTVNSNGVSHSSHNHMRNTNLPAVNDPFNRGLHSGNNCYSHRSNSYRFSSSYHPAGNATAYVEGRGSTAMESASSSRFSRPLSVSGRSSHRNGRMRSSYSRSRSSYDEDGSRSRWLSEGAAVVMDQSSFYDSRNWFDQYRDMRLDTDNMSYEELLALEERIGSVNTGLSEDTICGCLQEMTHCTSNQIEDDQEEDNCVICLEGYKDHDKLGRLSCGHDFHVTCIKNWLLIKNACPICKATACGNSSEKQT